MLLVLFRFWVQPLPPGRPNACSGSDLLLRDKLMNMDLEKFGRSLNDHNPPVGLTLPLTALWWDAKDCNSAMTHILRRGSPKRRGGLLRTLKTVNRIEMINSDPDKCHSGFCV